MDVKKENLKLWFKGLFCVFICIILLVFKFYYIPIGYFCMDLDENIAIKYEQLQEDYTYIFSLNGIKINIKDNQIIKPRLAYSGKTSNPYIALNNDKYYLVFPLSFKKMSENQILEYLKNKPSFLQNVQTNVVSIKDIRNNYQKINMDEVVFYKLNGINRIVYNNLDSFKIVSYSYRKEVSETELYWNKFDSYYYIISPTNVEDLFLQ